MNSFISREGVSRRNGTSSVLAVGAVLVLAAGCSAENTGVTAVESTAIVSGQTALEAMGVDVDQHIDPVSTVWDACPEPDRYLDPGVNVNAYVFRDAEESTFVEIGTPVRSIRAEGEGLVRIDSGIDDELLIGEYDDENGEVAAWCGPSNGHYAQGPIEGTIVIIPNDLDCPASREPGIMECPGAPIVYENDGIADGGVLEIDVSIGELPAPTEPDL